MYQYLDGLNHVASENKQREKMKAELEELQLNAVAVPFSFFDKKWDTGNKACTTGIHN